jgi:tight adherence protein B
VAAIIGFTALVTVAVMAMILVIRSMADRRREADQRLVGAPDSGVGLVPLAPITHPEPKGGARNRFDNWFELAVKRSGLEASPAGVVAVMILAATLLGSVLYFWKGQLGLAVLGVAIGIGVPLAVVAFMSRRYRWKLQSQIPDAYRMLAGSVRAGQTLEDAIEFYAEQGPKPLADEFAHCAGLMRLGMSPAAALQSTATRVRLLDFDLLVSTVGLYTQTGGNLVLLLERLADSVRDRNLFRGQFFAATAQSRVVAIAIGAAAPLLFLAYVLIEPEHAQAFLLSATGWSILVTCAILEIIGVIWLWWILRVDY